RSSDLGFSNQTQSISKDDGLKLKDAYVTAVVRCAPPANKPLPEERENCLPYLVEELKLMTHVRVIVTLGAFAWNGVLRAFRALGEKTTPRPKFAHGAEAKIGRYRFLGAITNTLQTH